MRFASRLLGPRAFDEVELIGSVLAASGTLVDVGAHVGLTLMPFANRGWEVFAFEPDPSNRAALLESVRDLPNVHVDPRAVAEVGGRQVPLYSSPVSTGISTLTAFHSTHTPTAQVTTVRLDDYLADAGVDDVELLKTDAEGHDFFVLRSFPWDRIRPRAVVCEFEDRKTEPLGYDYHDLARFLVARGYSVLVSEWHPVQEYGSRHRWRAIRMYPTSLSDEDAWGNLIAVPPELARRVLRAAGHARRRLQARLLVERVARRREGPPGSCPASAPSGQHGERHAREDRPGRDGSDVEAGN